MAHSRRPHHEETESHGTRSDWQSLVMSVREHPMAYIGGVVFVMAVIIIVAVFRQVSTRTVERENSALASALSADDITLKLDALTKLAGSSDVTDEAVYMLGETAFDAEKYDQAKVAFERVRDEYPQSKYVPTAVEGIADIEFEQGNYDAALELYQDIRERWPDSFAARRQPLNIARVYEKLNRYDEAVAAYQEQMSAFSGSATASMADQALQRLAASHPELFPEETPAVAEGETDTGAPPAAIAAPEISVSPSIEVTAPEAAPEPAEGAEEAPSPAEESEAAPAADDATPEEPAPATEEPADSEAAASTLEEQPAAAPEEAPATEEEAAGAPAEEAPAVETPAE